MPATKSSFRLMRARLSNEFNALKRNVAVFADLTGEYSLFVNPAQALSFFFPPQGYRFVFENKYKSKQKSSNNWSNYT